MNAKTAFLDRYVGPCPRDQVSLRDDPTSVVEKGDQDVVRSPPKRNILVRFAERAFREIQLERAKPKPACNRRASNRRTNLLNQHELFRAKILDDPSVAPFV